MPDPDGGFPPGSGRRTGVHRRSNCAMKRILMICVTALLALLLFAPVLSAGAEEPDPVSVVMDISNNRFTGPEEITVSIKVTNVTDADMPGPVSLYYPDGVLVQDFGNPTLAAGQTQSWTGTWTVTQGQLDLGKVTFALRWYKYNAAGELDVDGKNYSKAIVYVEGEPSVEINRFIVPTMASEGQQVSVTYEIVNTGTVDITNVTIREHSDISRSNATIATVPAGEKASHTFTVKMGKKDLTSKGTVTYRAGNSTETVSKEETVIKYGEIKLTANLTSDKKGGVVGDTVKLTLTLKNTGSADYQNVTVSDALLGELFTGTNVPANKTVTLDKEITITGSANYQFIVTGQDASGASVETATERISIVERDPSKAINLSVNASADRETVSSLPAVVRFKVQVTNNSANDVENVSVSASGVTLHNFAKIAAGETREFTRDVTFTFAGQFRFDATVTDELEEKQTFESNIVQIMYAQPTNAPTEAPIVTPPAPAYLPKPSSDGLPEYVNTIENVLSMLNHAFLVLAAICVALLAIGIVRRIQANHRAKDHLQRSSTRVYDMPAPKEKRANANSRDKVDKPIPEEPEKQEKPQAAAEEREESESESDLKPSEEAIARDGALMEETLRQLYERADRADAKSIYAPRTDSFAEDADAQADETPRRHRRGRTENEDA